MNYETYTQEVSNNLRSDGFQAADDIDDNPFGDVYAQRQTGLKMGVLNTMCTVVDAAGMRSGDLREQTDDFRSLLGDESFAKFGVGENMFGYIIFATPDATDELTEWMQDFEVKKRNSHVFPLVYDLESEEIHTHDVPRVVGRGLYKKQKRDAKNYFSIGEDDDSGGWI